MVGRSVAHLLEISEDAVTSHVWFTAVSCLCNPCLVSLRIPTKPPVYTEVMPPVVLI
jgi:hypothetical protein